MGNSQRITASFHRVTCKEIPDSVDAISDCTTIHDQLAWQLSDNLIFDQHFLLENWLVRRYIKFCLLQDWWTPVLDAEPHSSVDSVANLRTGGCWVDPQLSQYSYRWLMIIIATGSIPLSLLSLVSTMVIWKYSQWFGKNIVRSSG